MIQLNLTPEQYRDLVRIAYLGEWMINAPHDTEAQDEPAAQAFQGLLAAGAEALPDIDQDPETGDHFLSSEAADKFYDDHITDYDDHVFWDELAERLAVRDLAARRGVTPETIDREDNLAALRPLEERWRHEFERHGIERLDLGQS